MNPFTRLLQDPPPSMAFEISESGIAFARLRPKLELGFQPLAANVISVSPLRDNIIDSDKFTEAVRTAAPPNGKRRDVALVLPDYCIRIALLDFDSFPSDAKEQASLIRFRMKKSVPYDVESAALSYVPQSAIGKRHDVVVAAAPLEIVSRYEAPFRAAGMNPGFVTTSAIASLNLVAAGDTAVLAKLSGRVLTVMVLEKSNLRLVRSLELAGADLAEVASDLYPTFVYIEDQLGTKAARLLLCGFERLPDAAARFESELAISVERLPAQENNAGLLGYLQSAGQSVA